MQLVEGGPRLPSRIKLSISQIGKLMRFGWGVRAVVALQADGGRALQGGAQAKGV